MADGCDEREREVLREPRLASRAREVRRYSRKLKEAKWGGAAEGAESRARRLRREEQLLGPPGHCKSGQRGEPPLTLAAMMAIADADAAKTLAFAAEFRRRQQERATASSAVLDLEDELRSSLHLHDSN